QLYFKNKSLPLLENDQYAVDHKHAFVTGKNTILKYHKYGTYIFHFIIILQ
uniref:Uncharacterized protein n=1 Tax=Gopherus evgoodei TaxID=1825980 RepID=A0A8C4Y6W6_9SAUR